MSEQTQVPDETNPFYCNVRTEFDTKSNLTFQPFERTTAIANLHSKTPRFGHTNDINHFIQGNKSQQKDYLKGVLGASLGVFLFFLLWMLMLLLLKAMGPSKVSFFSGQRDTPPKPVKPEAFKRQERRRRKHPFQHNGVASGYNAPSRKSSKGGDSKSKTKPVVGRLATPVTKVVKPVASAPIKVVSKAREKKRELAKKKQFARMTNSGEFEVGELNGMEDHSEDNGDAPRSPGTTTSYYTEQASRVGGASGTASTDQSADTNQSSHNNSRRKPSFQPQTDQERKEIAKYEHEWKIYSEEIYKRRDRIRRIRVVAGFCSFGICVAAILFAIKGMDEFSASVDDTKNGLRHLSGITQDALDSMELFRERQTISEENTDKFILQVNDVCPAISTSFCTTDTLSNGTEYVRICDFSELPFGEPVTTLFGYLDGTFDLMFDELGDLEGDLREIRDLLDRADNYYPRHAAWAFWTAAGSCLALGGLTLYLTIGMVLLEQSQDESDELDLEDSVLPAGFKFVRSWIVVPLLLLLTCIGWLFAMIFIIVGMGSSDLCYNSPDGPIYNILEEMEDDFDSVIYSFLLYYVRKCPAAEVPRALEQAVSLVAHLMLPAIEDVVKEIQAQGEEQLEQTCGASMSPFVSILSALGGQYCLLSQAMASVRALFDCETWYPIYESTMHDAVCHHATSGFTWAASTQIVIIVLALVFLTLRVGFYELDEGVTERKDLRIDHGGVVVSNITPQSILKSTNRSQNGHQNAHDRGELADGYGNDDGYDESIGYEVEDRNQEEGEGVMH